MRSKDFQKIKDSYDFGDWPKSWVRNAVLKGRITAEEYKLITGEDFA